MDWCPVFSIFIDREWIGHQQTPKGFTDPSPRRSRSRGPLETNNDHPVFHQGGVQTCKTLTIPDLNSSNHAPGV